MKYKEKLQALIDENHGLILTKDASNAGIPRTYLVEFTKKGYLEKLERGVYITKDAFDDAMYRIQSKYPLLIFSHDTALFLHGLTDRDPLQYDGTVPAGYNSRNIIKSGVKVYSVKKELYEMGLATAKTPFGREIKTYDMERTICDILRSRSQIDITVLTDALKMYVKRPDKNLTKLMRYAEKLKVTKVLRVYMEVLL